MIALLDDPDGWEPFLRTIAPNTFTKPFAQFHQEFWRWYWRMSKMRRDGLPVTQEVLTFLALWARGAGKSSNIEWASIVEGALGLDGYVLYISLTQTSAESHVADIRKRLESERVSRYFPDLAEPLVGRHNNRYGWRQDFMQTKGGWAIRPIGLDTAVRGLREGDLRPSIMIFDDIDDYHLSLAAVEQNLNVIARSILPAGTSSTLQLVAQNLIAEHSAVNQIYTGKSPVLADHIASFQPAFVPGTLVIDKNIDPVTGKPGYEIIQGTPAWEGMNMADARVFLNKVGPEAFNAEYQHDFSLDQTEKVIPEFDDSGLYPANVITWSQFEEKFGTRYRVPEHWQVGVGLDIGYTSHHLSAWTWIAVSAEDSEVPNCYFIYRGKTYLNISINDQARDVLGIITHRLPDGRMFDERDQYILMRMSHEKKGERMVLNREYEFNFAECAFKKEDGVPQWRSLLRTDKKLPHPFHEDTLDADGRYTIGRSNMYYVVEDSQLQIPRDDMGLAIHRAQLYNWKRKKVQLTASGVADAIPVKWEDDTIDSTRMLLAEQLLSAAPLSNTERRRRALRESLQTSDILLQKGRDDYGGVLLRRQMEIAEIEQKEREELDRIARVVRHVLNAPPMASQRKR